MTGEELADLVRRGSSCTWNGLTISGDVDLAAVEIARTFRIRDARFTGTVNLSQARFERGADFTGCHFQKLILSDARIEGPLLLDDVELGTPKEPEPDVDRMQRIITTLKEGRQRARSNRSDSKDKRLKQIKLQLRRRATRVLWEERSRKAQAEHQEPTIVADLNNLRVAGCVSLMNARVFGSLYCTHAGIEDDFRIDRSHIHGDLKLRRANLGELCSDGGMRLPDAGPGAESHGMPCRIDGELDLTSAHVGGDVRLLGVSIGKELSLQTAEIKGNLLCRTRELSHADRKIQVRSRLGHSAWLLGARIGGTVDFGGTRIYGILSLGTATLGGGLEGSHSGKWALTVHGDIDLTNAHLAASCSFTDSGIRGSANLSGARIGSDLSFTGARVAGDLLLQNASIGGNIFLTATSYRKQNVSCKIQKYALLLGADVTGNVNVSGAWIGHLVLQNAKIGNNVYATVLSGLRTHIESEMSLDNASVGANIYMIGTHVGGHLTLQNASVGGTFFCTATSDLAENLPCHISTKAWLLGASFSGSIDIGGAHICGNLIMQSVKVGQDLQAKIMGGFRTQVDGDVFLNGARIAGVAEFAGPALQRKLILENALIEGGLLVSFGFTDFPSWNIVRAHIGSGIHADSATIGKRVMLVGLDVCEEPGHACLESALEGRAVDFSGAQVNGAFSLYSPDVAQGILESQKAGFVASVLPEDQERDLLTQARRELTAIRGDLRLRRAEVLGGIVLDGCTITGDLDLQDANVRANITCRPVELTSSGELARASVDRADFETLNLTGDLNLTGLAIDGDLILRDTRIRGRLELHPADAGNGRPEEEIASIGGALRLDAAEISHIVVSGRSFGQRLEPERSLWERIASNVRTAWRREDYLLIMFFLRGGNPEEEVSFANTRADIVLERATVGRLEIVDPLPGKLDLSNLTVGSWEEYERASFFRDTLRRSYPFKRSSYLAIENDLRNKGRDEEADRVHVCMRQRDRVNTDNFGRVLWDRLLDLSTKYGTTSARLFWLMLVMFAISVWLFSDPSHVEYNIAPSRQAQPPIVHLSPDPREWSMGDAIFLAVRLHVPIVSLGIDEEVQPSRTWLKAYAVAAVAASWVMWPLFIASVSGFLRKRS
jgi:uncharacterized protein YjbI with pentapeptide repeats